MKVIDLDIDGYGNKVCGGVGVWKIPATSEAGA